MQDNKCLKCPKCDEEFKKKSEYEEHMKLEPCVIRLFINKAHYDTYEKVPEFLSEHVNFKKMILGNSYQKQTVVHEEDEEGKEGKEGKDGKEHKVFKCKICDNIFSRADSLSRHVKKFCKIKKELDPLKATNPHLQDDRDEDLGDFDMEEFKDKIDELMQNYLANKT